MRRPPTFAWLALLLAALACGPTIGELRDGAIGETADESVDGPSPLPPVELPSEVPIAPEAEASPESDGLPASIRDQMFVIEQQVTQLRELGSSGSVDRALLTPDELRQHVIDDFFADYSEEEAADDVRVLSLLGLLEPGFDLYNFYLNLYSEQIAGFYDDEQAVMYVVQGAGFGGPERITYAHEYVHALQDIAYDMDEGLGFSDEACEDDSERCAALRALLEGDATIAEFQWFSEHATEADFQELREFIDTLDTPVYDSAPSWLRDDFAWPYTAGEDFVSTFYDQGGWRAVADLYANPPLSTEQILHPERYPADVPLDVEVPDIASALGAEWEHIDEDLLGEWFTQLILREQLQQDYAARAADGWGGDSYVAYHNPERGQNLLVAVAEWDTSDDATEFYTALADYGRARFGEPAQADSSLTVWNDNGGWSSIELGGNRTVWILAPDGTIGQALGAVVTP